MISFVILLNLVVHFSAWSLVLSLVVTCVILISNN